MEQKEIKIPGSYADIECLTNEYLELGIDRTEIPKRLNENEYDYLERAITTNKIIRKLLELGLERDYNFNTENRSEIEYYREKIRIHEELPIVNYGVGIGNLTKEEDEHDIVYIKRQLKLKNYLKKYDRHENETADKFYNRIEKRSFLGTIWQDNMGDIDGDITTPEQLSGRYLIDSINSRDENIKYHFAVWERIHELEEEGFSFDRKDQNDAISQFKKIFDERYMEHSDDDYMPDALDPVDESKYIVTKNIVYDGEGNSKMVTTRAFKGDKIGEVSDKGLKIGNNEYIEYNPAHMSPLDDILNRKNLTIRTGEGKLLTEEYVESPMTITPRDMEVGIHSSRFERPRTPIRGRWSSSVHDMKDKSSIEKKLRESRKATLKRRKVMWISIIALIIILIFVAVEAGKRYKEHHQNKITYANTHMLQKEIELTAKGADIYGIYDFKVIIRPEVDSQERILEKIRQYENFVKNRKIENYKIRDIGSMKNLVVKMTELDRELNWKQITAITLVVIAICILVSVISIGILAIKVYIMIYVYKCITGKDRKNK